MYVCRPIVLQPGLWDQVRVDCGREFALLLLLSAGLVVIFLDKHSESTICTNTIQTGIIYCFGLMRTWVKCPAVFLSICRTTSWLIHMWITHAVQIPSRMQQNRVINLDCPITKYSVSLMVGKLCQVGIQLHVCAWNSHRIPGKHCEHAPQIHACSL